MLNILIVDDEEPARDELRHLLSQENGVKIAGQADSGAAALELAAKLKINVVFLDIKTRGMNGLETAVLLQSVVPEALFVFATAYDEYAVQAFKIGAVDYILKPFERERVQTTVKRLKNYCGAERRIVVEQIDAVLNKTKIVVRKLPVKKNGKIILVDYKDIIYFHTQKGIVNVVTVYGNFDYANTLTELEKRLSNTNLVRVHKSYILNMDKVQEVVPWFKGTYCLKVEGDAEIPISKSRIKDIKDILGLK